MRSVIAFLVIFSDLFDKSRLPYCPGLHQSFVIFLVSFVVLSSSSCIKFFEGKRISGESVHYRKGNLISVLWKVS